ncbi:GNL3L [Blepharisma stoltei]|uniref:CP-type G domain-containing protein n=1 Tax=Blepharisma stoltei TaxID=1481888 RepID=A0AAU9JU19_9CILI|nr:unnamed protein product [Blepharisma stoltei]
MKDKQNNKKKKPHPTMKNNKYKAIPVCKLKKTPDLPRVGEFKKKLLEELKRKKPTEERERQIQALSSSQEASRHQSLLDKVIEAQSKAQLYTSKEEEEEVKTYTDHSMKSYHKDITQVIESSDIILEVLDARDPLGCRSIELENKVLSFGHKKIIIVLNKIDLVPGDVALGWYNHLSQYLPVVLFRCNTQNQQKGLSSSNLHRKNVNTELANDILDSKKTVGSEALMGLIKNYMRSGNVMTAVTIGVAGYPNVGKSSLINSLKRTKVVGVSSTPGFTTGVQEVEIESKIKILDCPGVVFAKSDGRENPEMVLRNVINIESVEDPITPVQAILQKVAPDQLMNYYKIPQFQEGIEFLAHIARARGKMKKGGIPDLDASAKIVLHDWVAGKISYYTLPPDSLSMSLE